MVEALLGALLLAAAGVAAWLAWRIVANRRETEAAKAEVGALNARLEQSQRDLGEARGYVQALRRYEGIVDVEGTSKRLREEAAQWASKHRADAESLATKVVTDARGESNRIVTTANAQAAEIKRAAEASAAKLTADTRAEAARVAAENEGTRTAASSEAMAVRGLAEAWASQHRAQTEAWAAKLVADSRAEASSIVASATREKAGAEVEAGRIIAAAQKRAEETAGDALAAVHEAKRLQQTAQAMKNVIEGYGDRYIVPSVGLLDDLAEELGFTEAGQLLKAARDRVRAMIKQGIAATCEYVEAHRRATAIDFVLDAFNGKVDTVLADVRHDNFGTLQQKIHDAFALVNHNGRAFRDARIELAYRDARIEELRWACTAHELKLKEREEQRQLKERIREEERAQREFEKAVKDAEKEQDVLRKAMEKARRDVEKSSEAERAAFEAKLRELTERLQVAEEKNRRAISMAQQTKSGHVYVISNIGSFGENVYKIGMTRRLEPLDRVRELGDASVPFEFDVHALIPSTDAPALERELHRKFVREQVNKVNPRKEFFRVQLQDVRKELDTLGVEVAWTLTAGAREYRESMAVEAALVNKTIDEKVWAQQQAAAEARMVPELEEV